MKPRKEGFVEQQLRAADLEFSCPRYTKIVRHARTTKRIAKPLFPGYVFIKLNHASTNWRTYNWIQGSLWVVGFNGQPSPLPQVFVDSFINNRGDNDWINFKQNFKLGDRVKAIGGPFDSQIGEIIALPNQDRVKILTAALNRKVEVDLPRMAVISAA